MIPRLYRSLLFLFLVSHSYLINAQNNLSNNFDICIKNWESLHDQGDYDEAIRQAGKALLSATKLNDKERMAIALNKEATSLIMKPKNIKKNRKIAKEKFERSLFYLEYV